MKMYSCNEKKMKWYRKVNWLKTVLIFIITFSIFFAFFHFFIGGVGMLNTAIITSLKISLFITLGVIISYCISNRINLYVLKDDKLYIIYPHSFGVEYDDGIVSYKEFRKLVKNEESVVNIIENTDKYTGIDVIKVKKVIDVKKYKKCFKVKVEASCNYWKAKGNFFTVDSYSLNKKSDKMVLTIPYDYTKYNELCDLISGMKK